MEAYPWKQIARLEMTFRLDGQRPPEPTSGRWVNKAQNGAHKMTRGPMMAKSEARKGCQIALTVAQIDIQHSQTKKACTCLPHIHRKMYWGGL